MSVKILQTDNLGFIITQVEDSFCCEDEYSIINPRILQMFIRPNEAGKPTLDLQMQPIVYKEVLSVDDFTTQVSKKTYRDVTSQFDESIIDTYMKVENIGCDKEKCCGQSCSKSED